MQDDLPNSLLSPLPISIPQTHFSCSLLLCLCSPNQSISYLHIPRSINSCGVVVHKSPITEKKKKESFAVVAMRFILGASQWPWRQCRRATISIIRHSSTNNHSNTSTAASAIEAKRREARLGGGRARIDAQHSKVAKNISMIPLKRVFLTILVGKINCPRAAESLA